MTNQHRNEPASVILGLCAVKQEDYAGCVALLQRPVGDAVASALDMLGARWGTFPAEGLKRPGSITTDAWEQALLRFAPVAAKRMALNGIAPRVIEATLADIGRQFELHRATHGTFGMATDWWSTLHLSGSLYRLGRLQFHVHRESGSDAWVLGVHIPEDGPLDVASVDSAFALATGFFAEHFPAQTIEHAYCDSWLLDPYLFAGLPKSNMARFAARFSNVELHEAPADALYFTFRAPADVDISTLPRESSLQRLVLGRIDEGGTWQAGKGRTPWPVPALR